jgi:RimJ/RimL family protein N-acetyltransferase
VAGFLEWLEKARRSDDSVEFVIETIEGEAIGACDLRQLNDRNRSANLGIWIAKPYWDRGFGTDAVRTLCRFGFRHMNLQRVDLQVYADNVRGRRAYEKVGFKLEGTLRRAQFVGGRYVDALVMGLLAEEFVDG